MYLSTILSLLFLFLTSTTLAMPLNTRSTKTITITTPLPPTTPPASVLTLLHNATYMIAANGLVTSQTQTSTDPPTFLISDDLIKLPFPLPFGIKNPFTTTYTATFENTPDGLVTRSDAGGGLLRLIGTWAVTGSELRENVTLEGNALVVFVAGGFVRKAHGDMHVKILRDAAAAAAAVAAGAGA